MSRSKRAPDTAPQLRQGEVLEFMRLLWAVDHGLQAVSKRMEARLGVTGPQRLVIRMLGRFPNILARDLAALLHMHKSTLTGVLDRLERRGIIERREDPDDRRRARLTLTRRGEALDRVKVGTVEAKVRRVLTTMSAGSIQAARKLLAALGQALLEDDELERRA